LIQATDLEEATFAVHPSLEVALIGVDEVQAERMEVDSPGLKPQLAPPTKNKIIQQSTYMTSMDSSASEDSSIFTAPSAFKEFGAFKDTSAYNDSKCPEKPSVDSLLGAGNIKPNPLPFPAQSSIFKSNSSFSYPSPLKSKLKPFQPKFKIKSRKTHSFLHKYKIPKLSRTNTLKLQKSKVEPPDRHFKNIRPLMSIDTGISMDPSLVSQILNEDALLPSLMS